MTAAGTLVQILYQVYAALDALGATRATRRTAARIVGLAALVLYYVGIYLLYYLSRTREYLADAFSAERVEARHLASALVKIAYGIVQGGGHRRHPEPVAEHAAHGRHRRQERAPFRARGRERRGAPSTERASEAMLFDAYNPWARLIELNSTHPLTGHAHRPSRRHRQGRRAQPFADYDIEGRRRCACASTRGALWSQFWRELGILAATGRRCHRRRPDRRLAAGACRRCGRPCYLTLRLRYPPAPRATHDRRRADDQPRRVTRRRPPGAASPARRSDAPIQASSPARTSSIRTRPAS